MNKVLTRKNIISCGYLLSIDFICVRFSGSCQRRYAGKVDGRGQHTLKNGFNCEYVWYQKYVNAFALPPSESSSVQIGAADKHLDSYEIKVRQTNCMLRLVLGNTPRTKQPVFFSYNNIMCRSSSSSRQNFCFTLKVW